ncbi:MAG: preprotein translocase subunit YajC [Actinobacteria bacterium]|nr:preprotein translocase subunit YajC [Actinomycetota bacterium]
METIVMVALMGAALYFLLLRPQQKRAKEQQAKMAALEAGARIMTISGIVGTIRHLGEKQAIIEVAPGVEFTIDKRAISTQPVEDEFEYVDDAAGEVTDAEAIEPVSDYPTFESFDPTPPPADEDPRQN